jgi:hypothetical protein
MEVADGGRCCGHAPRGVRAIVTTSEPTAKLAAVIAETEARCPVLNLLLDAKVDLKMEWLRNDGGTGESIARM